MHRRHTMTRMLGVAALIALSLSACGSDNSETKKAPLPAANSSLKGTVTLGAVLPLTGTNATIGMDQQRGIEMAVAKINAGEGVLGKKLVVKVEDSEGRADSAIQAARKLVNVDKVPAVIGDYSSGNTIPMQEFLQREGVVGVNPGSSSIDVRKGGSLQFSVIGLDDVAGAFVAKQLMTDGFKSIALLAPNNAYGTGMVDSVTAAFKQLGGSVTSTGLYTEGQSDYRQELGRMKDSKPGAYVLTTYGKDGATINKEMFELGLSEKKVFGIYLSMDVPDADPKSVEGRIGIDVNTISESGKSYAAAYKKTYGESFITAFNGYTYDATTMLALAINETKSAKSADIATGLTKISTNFEGVTGPLTFDADGQRAEQPYLVAQVKNGEIVAR